MESKRVPFIWSGNWHIEDSKAWFVAGEYNVIFQLDMDNGQCEYCIEIPNNSIGTYSLNIFCAKYENNIFCMPQISNDIWIYQIDTQQFSKIQLVKSDKENGAVVVNDFWAYGNRIFAVARRLKQIIVINIEERKIENRYNLFAASDITIGRSIMVGSSIYIACDSTNRVCQFDIITGKIALYTLPDVEGGIYAICFDGKDFWLSGFRREVYKWDNENNRIDVIDRFPESFGIYDYSGDGERLLDCETTVYNVPVFESITALGQYIWFIPMQTNEILYIDKNTNQVSAFEIEGEEETESSLKIRNYYMKYTIQYVREDRYIGVYSYKDKCIYEIDALERTVEKKEYSYSEEVLEKMMQIYDVHRGAYKENYGIDMLLFENKFGNTSRSVGNMAAEDVGPMIHKAVTL